MTHKTKELKTDQLKDIMAATNWNITLAMAVMGLSGRENFYKILKRHGLERPDKDTLKAKALKNINKIYPSIIPEDDIQAAIDANLKKRKEQEIKAQTKDPRYKLGKEIKAEAQEEDIFG